MRQYTYIHRGIFLYRGGGCTCGTCGQNRYCTRSRCPFSHEEGLCRERTGREWRGRGTKRNQSLLVSSGGKDGGGGGGTTGAEAVERGGGMGKEEEMKGRGSNV